MTRDVLGLRSPSWCDRRVGSLAQSVAQSTHGRESAEEQQEREARTIASSQGRTAWVRSRLDVPRTVYSDAERRVPVRARQVDAEYAALERSDMVADLVSYAVGCMFGRYSLDEPGLILADQGATLQDYLAKVPTPTFVPDADNVIPIVDGDWFEDDIVGRFRQFLRALSASSTSRRISSSSPSRLA